MAKLAEFVGNLVGNDDLAEEPSQQLRLPDRAKVENDRGVRDNDHSSFFSVSMSSCSISTV